MSTVERTPMMQQFWDAKQAHPGKIILFRNGDFYELFEDDAELGHKVLGLTLTKRDEKIPMAGFPQVKLEFYLGLLLKAGHRVAVCEQMEESKAGQKLIRREVNRVVTPGTVTEDDLLDPRKPNHLLSIYPAGNVIGLAWVDLSTGQFWAQDCSESRARDEITRIQASEYLLPDGETECNELLFGTQPPLGLTLRPRWTFDPDSATHALQQHFQVKTLSGFGFDDRQPCLIAAGAVLVYLQETLKTSLAHIRRIAPFRVENCLVLDEVTRRSLELTRTLRDNSRLGSLLSVLDRTVTPMGARLLHDSLLAPLNQLPEIQARLDTVEELLRDHALRGELREMLEQMADLQRLTTRVSTAKAVPRELVAIAKTLRQLPRLKAKLVGRKSPLLRDWESRLELCPDIRELLDRSLIEEEPPITVKDGGIIKEGYSAELDELRGLARDGKNWIARYQAEQITRTGITSLKVGYNQIDGYYIEITNANETKTPPEFRHQKTLKNAKRYYTAELREYEEKVLSAEDKSKALEFDLYVKIRDQVATYTPQLLATSEVLAGLDLMAGLAELAAIRNYVRPQLTEDSILEIQDGRHPVLDQILPPGRFVPNDVEFGDNGGSFWLITGPNMSGKSTFIRQVALLTLMAHIGSFVPARSAVIGITDRIFTRVGASDELSRGYSTFMVEMTEAANILNNATPRSLVILDEIGRGTSTYDGVSLAWAITEHLHDAVGCRSLFATHYHELAQLASVLPRMRNYTVQVREVENDVIFLHKIAAGSADKSYGIHVARLAGVPEAVLTRAEAVLATLESPHQRPLQDGMRKPRKKAVKAPDQMVEPPESEPKKKAKGPIPSLFGSLDDHDS